MYCSFWLVSISKILSAALNVLSYLTKCSFDIFQGQKVCTQKSVTNKLQHTIKSLKPSKNYTVVVTATNEYKQASPASNEAHFMTTLCNQKQFECLVDGSCVALNVTCDGVKSCPDAADEKAIAGCSEYFHYI